MDSVVFHTFCVFLLLPLHTIIETAWHFVLVCPITKIAIKHNDVIKGKDGGKVTI